MPQLGQEHHGTYRCPVCRHRDLAVIERGQERAVVECSYCETLLVVYPRGADSVHLSVQVADVHVRR